MINCLFPIERIFRAAQKKGMKAAAFVPGLLQNRLREPKPSRVPERAWRRVRWRARRAEKNKGQVLPKLKLRLSPPWRVREGRSSLELPNCVRRRVRQVRDDCCAPKSERVQQNWRRRHAAGERLLPRFRLSKNLRRVREDRSLSNFQTYPAACTMGERRLFAAKSPISGAKTGEGGMRRERELASSSARLPEHFGKLRFCQRRNRRRLKLNVWGAASGGGACFFVCRPVRTLLTD